MYWIDRHYRYLSPIRFIMKPFGIYEPLIWSLLIVGFPLWSFFIYKSMEFYYQRKCKHYESLIEFYKSKQKLELETLKKKTKYYQMKSLIQRYEGGDELLSNISQNVISSDPNLFEQKKSLDINENKELVPEKRHSPSWMNRFVDSVLLNENNIQSYTTTMDGTSVLFALICHFCYSHNGFLNQKDYETLPCYICPKCGQLNTKNMNHGDKNEDITELGIEKKTSDPDLNKQ